MLVAIARAFFRHPKVMVLDEPTAALDGESAVPVAEALRNVVKEGDGVAVVVITHDLRVMKEADKVVVLNEGVSVVEERFEELRWKRGALARLVGGGEVV